MKLTSYLLFSILLLACFTSCDDEDVLPNLGDVPAPSELSLNFSIANDNSGEVTIQPNGRGVTSYAIDFGDGSEPLAELAPGEAAINVYELGTYNVVLTAMGINGLTTSFSQELTVSFLPPQNLVVTITPTPGNALSIDVTATADLETNFQVFFGEDPTAEPVTFIEGQTVSYAYQAVGTYDVRVVAISGGAASIEETTSVTISNPVVLPLDFENPSLNYEIFGFGSATASIIDNPDVSEGNNSSRVATMAKPAGSEVWAGVAMPLGEVINFNGLTQVKMNVWSPRAGVSVLLKLENGDDNTVFIEVATPTTVANSWEELVFNFAGADFSNEYQTVVVFFDFGTSGMNEVFYFDEIELTDGMGELNFPLDFEANDIEFAFTGFGGANAEVINNPDASGINTSSKVGQFIKNVGSETWGGVFIDVDEPIDFSGTQNVKLKIWSPVVGAPILLKIENPADGDINREATVNTTVANQWEELTFNLSGIQDLANIRRVVLFCNFGTSGNAQPYYFDDIQLAQ